MAKRLSISINQNVYDSYLAEPMKNRSEYIEHLIIMGSEAISKGEANIQGKVAQLVPEKERLNKEVCKLQKQLERQKHEYTNKLPVDVESASKLSRGLKNAGLLRNL
jgi:metal-responsive CopG/Arc/MetJ family transcriptional regulator